MFIEVILFVFINVKLKRLHSKFKKTCFTKNCADCDLLAVCELLGNFSIILASNQLRLIMILVLCVTARKTTAFQIIFFLVTEGATASSQVTKNFKWKFETITKLAISREQVEILGWTFNTKNARCFSIVCRKRHEILYNRLCFTSFWNRSVTSAAPCTYIWLLLIRTADIKVGKSMYVM